MKGGFHRFLLNDVALPGEKQKLYQGFIIFRAILSSVKTITYNVVREWRQDQEGDVFARLQNNGVYFPVRPALRPAGNDNTLM
jgi:hypothetical protein